MEKLHRTFCKDEGEELPCVSNYYCLSMKKKTNVSNEAQLNNMLPVYYYTDQNYSM